MKNCIFLAIYIVLISATRAYYQNKLIVNCLNVPDNTGNYLVNTFYSDTSRGSRAQAIRGQCKPGTTQVHDLNENIGYAWIKGESPQKSYFKVTSQQMIKGKYMYETWSYKRIFAFVVSSKTNIRQKPLPGIRSLVLCGGNDGRDKNGYCELAGPERTTLRTKIPYSGTVQDIDLKPPSAKTTFKVLKYNGITKGGAIYGQYWDYRNMKWNKDDCYTFTAYFSDGLSFEVTTPIKDFSSQTEAKKQAEPLLQNLGTTPKFTRSWLKTIAVNGDGRGARAGANSWRKSMNVNLADWILQEAYKLFLHEGAHVSLLYIQNSEKWKTAQKLDPTYISTYARDSSSTEDVPESFVPWMSVKQQPNTIQGRKITQTIPNRLAVFDDLICSKYPDTCA